MGGLILCLFLASGEAEAAGFEPATDFSWRYVMQGGEGDNGELEVVAADPQGPRWAVGGRRGVAFYAAEAGSHGPRLPRVGAVRDLAYDSKGVLWIGSDRWLWSWREGPGLEHHALVAGEQANRIRCVVAAGGRVLVGTGAGVFSGGEEDRRFGPLRRGLPRAKVDALAARERNTEPGAIEVWAAIEGKLWRVESGRGESGEESLRPTGARLIPISGVPVSEGPIQIALDIAGFDVVIVYSHAMALRREPSEPFEIVRPVSGPGARIQWLSPGADRFWLATDGGLFWAEAIAGPWRRSKSPAGSQPIAHVAARDREVMVASRVGLLEGRGARSEAAPDQSESRDPEIGAVQRETLRYLGLNPERFRRLRREVDRSGWWPTLRLRAGASFGRERGRNYDQHFSYGDLHHLRDRNSGDQRDLDASVELAWDFGDGVLNPLAVDLSRELRQRVALRDDVLDQVNQVYFERQVVLARFRQLEPGSPEAGSLALRALELAAGLDGWTGGWFGRSLTADVAP